ncbi:MAG: hypothetical protein NTU66_01420 [Elusimicrobia bacterium]|nr:hypothetical protein [Elusimicrobiota bacterium]
MNCTILTKSHSGQALVESIFLIPIIVLIIISLSWFSRVLITRQQLVIAARYGTDMIVSTNLNEGQIRQEIRNFLSHRLLQSRQLDEKKLPDENIVVKINDFPYIHFNLATAVMRPQDLFKMLSRMANPLSATSTVDIKYEYDIPPVFRALTHQRIFVSARSEVLSGTGCPARIHARS